MRRATGQGPTFWERQRRRVECPECGVEVAAELLLTHCKSQHVKDHTYRVSSPKTLVTAPVNGSGLRL